MEYYEPNFLDEALVLLDRFGSEARILAGGTRLAFRLRHEGHATGALINLKRIGELGGVELAAGALRVGALCTAAELRSHPLVRQHAPLLAAAAATMGAAQLQTVATLGGNVTSGDAASDLSVALVAHAASCRIEVLDDVAALVPVEQVLARQRPVLAPRELLTTVDIPLGQQRCSYQKMTTRHGFEMALVAVALALRMEGEVIGEARIGLAGVAPSPMRATHAEALLAGKAPTPSVVREAARAAASSDARPRSDARASAEYRRALVATLVERAVLSAR
jgi:aerobic carbon-monoxide dehydrogenase medium subunit